MPPQLKVRKNIWFGKSNFWKIMKKIFNFLNFLFKFRYINGKAIKLANRIRSTHDFGYVSLDILNAYKEDSGTYMCKAVNQLGEAVNTCSVEITSGQSLLMDSQHPEGNYVIPNNSHLQAQRVIKWSPEAATFASVNSQPFIVSRLFRNCSFKNSKFTLVVEKYQCFKNNLKINFYLGRFSIHIMIGE